MRLDPDNITVRQLNEDFLTARQMLKAAPISRQRVRQILAGPVDYVRVHGRNFIERSSLEEWLRIRSVDRGNDRTWTGNPEQIHTPLGAAHLLGLTYRTINAQDHNGALRPITLAGKRFYREADLVHYRDNHLGKVGQPGEPRPHTRGKKGPHFTHEERKARVAETIDLPITKAAAKIGVSYPTLANWRRRYADEVAP